MFVYRISTIFYKHIGYTEDWLKVTGQSYYLKTPNTQVSCSTVAIYSRCFFFLFTN